VTRMFCVTLFTAKKWDLGSRIQFQEVITIAEMLAKSDSKMPLPRGLKTLFPF
jgi:hypothetical protein